MKKITIKTKWNEYLLTQNEKYISIYLVSEYTNRNLLLVKMDNNFVNEYYGYNGNLDESIDRLIKRLKQDLM